MRLYESAVVDDVVDHRGYHLVVAERRVPPSELQVGGDHHGVPLVGIRERLEQRPCAVGV